MSLPVQGICISGQSGCLAHFRSQECLSFPFLVAVSIPGPGYKNLEISAVATDTVCLCPLTLTLGITCTFPAPVTRGGPVPSEISTPAKLPCLFGTNARKEKPSTKCAHWLGTLRPDQPQHL